MKRNALYLAGFVLLGCSGEAMVVGDGESDPASGNAANASMVPASSCGTLAELEAEIETSYGASSVAQRHVGRWRGFVGNIGGSNLPADDAVLEVRSDGTGTVVFGQGEPPPLPTSSTDASLCVTQAVPGYPPGFGSCMPDRMFPGMAYTLRNIRSDGVRLTAKVPIREPWTAWCALQTPMRGPDATFADGSFAGCQFLRVTDFRGSEANANGACFLTDPMNPSRGPKEPIDCDYLYMSYAVHCTCRVDGCLYDGGAHELDIALFDDNQGLIGVWDSVNIQFRRE
jgi:hypothetical protein